MSHIINGVRINSKSVVDLNDFLVDLRSAAKEKFKVNHKHLLDKLCLNMISKDTKTFDYLILTAFFDSNLMESEPESITIEDLLSLHYKKSEKRSLNVFVDKRLPFALINTGRLYEYEDLPLSLNNRLIEPFWYSTYSGESSASDEKALEIIKNKVKEKNPLLNEEEIDEKVNLIAEMETSYVMRTWNTFTKDSFFINEHSFETILINEEEEYADRLNSNTLYDVELFSDYIKSISFEDHNKLILRMYSNEASYKENDVSSHRDFIREQQKKINDPEFIKLAKIRFTKDMEQLSEHYTNKTILEVLKEFNC